ncbi:MAG: aminoacyl-tRNA hydrolase [Spirochaetaceae bacterium]|nr:aminoacyl-tRNA hydrolase [Spirochaetaceae bacterium]
MDHNAIAASVLSNAEIEFSRSGGPGGQNVNKLNTKVTARIGLDSIEGLSPAEMQLVKIKLANRIASTGELVVQVQEERSQGMNREIAIKKLVALITRAARRNPPRIPTKPTRASRERKLATKKVRTRIKTNRRPPSIEY